MYSVGHLVADLAWIDNDIACSINLNLADSGTAINKVNTTQIRDQMPIPVVLFYLKFFISHPYAL